MILKGVGTDGHTEMGRLKESVSEVKSRFISVNATT
jgi:hypothetical protein